MEGAVRVGKVYLGKSRSRDARDLSKYYFVMDNVKFWKSIDMCNLT